MLPGQYVFSHDVSGLIRAAAPESFDKLLMPFRRTEPGLPIDKLMGSDEEASQKGPEFAEDRVAGYLEKLMVEVEVQLRGLGDGVGLFDAAVAFLELKEARLVYVFRDKLHHPHLDHQPRLQEVAHVGIVAEERERDVRRPP